MFPQKAFRVVAVFIRIFSVPEDLVDFFQKPGNRDLISAKEKVPLSTIEAALSRVCRRSVKRGSGTVWLSRSFDRWR